MKHARSRAAGEVPLYRTWLAGLLLSSCAARGQVAASGVNVSVDARAAGAPLDPIWAFHGYDELNYTTTAEGKALLATLAAAHSAPVYVRNHFWLNTGDGTAALKWGSTDVYREDAAGNPIYDWVLTDQLLDTITAAGTRPFVEIAFMPEALSVHPAPYQNSSSLTLDGGSFYPPKDYVKWGHLIRAWATHARERYPDTEASWLWELWNEPDIGYWNGTFEEYAKLYDHTEAALHDVLPKARFGGPAVAGAGSSFLRQFLQHCATGTNAVTGQTGTRLDLVSFHAKGGVSISEGGHVQMDLGNQLRLHRAGFSAVKAVPQFEQTPVYITEADPDGCAACPASSKPANAYRNSTAYGAYEVAMMKRTLELAERLGVNLRGVLTWAFTFPGTPYFAGYRALASNGIQLPVLSAFQLLGKLSGAWLPLSSTGARPLDELLELGVRSDPEIDGMAALDGSTIRVLIWNYHDDLVPVTPTPVQLAVQVPSDFGASARVSHLRVDESHGDAYSVWLDRGTPEQPSAADLEALQQAMEPSLLSEDQTVPVSDGAVVLDFDLPRFGVSLLTIRGRNADSSH